MLEVQRIVKVQELVLKERAPERLVSFWSTCCASSVGSQGLPFNCSTLLATYKSSFGARVLSELANNIDIDIRFARHQSRDFEMHVLALCWLLLFFSGLLASYIDQKGQ